jgi:hypothetical protein
MIEFACEQRSLEWNEARRGIPTASQFSRIVTPKALKPSKSAELYTCELVFAAVTGIVVDTDEDYMTRGTQLEDEAISLYEFTRDVKTRKAGFIFKDESRTCGGSPDRLVDPDGGLEVKVPRGSNHVRYLLGGFDDEHRIQVQALLWITGRKWWDLMSYHSMFKPAIVRCVPDSKVFAAFDAMLPTFTDHLVKMIEKAR